MSGVFFNFVFKKNLNSKKNLTNHLDLVVRIFAQDHYSMNTFPFEAAINHYVFVLPSLT
jgi:hypothetical protein